MQVRNPCELFCLQKAGHAQFLRQHKLSRALYLYHESLPRNIAYIAGRDAQGTAAPNLFLQLKSRPA
jgi:hypothetical protein